MIFILFGSQFFRIIHLCIFVYLLIHVCGWAGCICKSASLPVFVCNNNDVCQISDIYKLSSHPIYHTYLNIH